MKNILDFSGTDTNYLRCFSSINAYPLINSSMEKKIVINKPLITYSRLKSNEFMTVGLESWYLDDITPSIFMKNVTDFIVKDADMTCMIGGDYKYCYLKIKTPEQNGTYSVQFSQNPNSEWFSFDIQRIIVPTNVSDNVVNPQEWVVIK